ncbi:MAG: dUTP diphosphatase [Candidatus Syntrophonatronum acetioxidans]|uniref:Deoxyuridine 5'-triphosphate nucleotidohydrolase n=1 Tax=Candidatus Syntrophonatronum acetioxidans TaxID=1795816 RepID=A0A424YDJ4_9FIRM|nr:MAG: dUTP diphosphatase [Candidatus Syntrophonatronum acetioxidans]
MKKIKVEIKVLEKAKDLPLPQYESPGSAGMDLRAALEKDLELMPGKHCLIPTGLKISLPENYEGQVRPRSGLALKYGITVLNAPGTLDSDYRGELKVILINLGETPYTIKRGDRIAQLIIAPLVKADLMPVEVLSGTKRGEGGFGHSGLE